MNEQTAEVHEGHHTPEEIRREMKVYLWVFAGLAFLTVVTVVLVFVMKMPVHLAILVALAVASIKGFLVAGFFMHLLSERKLIYAVLTLTVIFFAVLLWLPVHDILDKFGR